MTLGDKKYENLINVWRKRPLEHTRRVGECEKKMREKQQGKNTKTSELNVYRTDELSILRPLAQYLIVREGSTTAASASFHPHWTTGKAPTFSELRDRPQQPQYQSHPHSRWVVNRKRKKKNQCGFHFVLFQRNTKTSPWVGKSAACLQIA